ncbi:hypothetical protein JCM10207_007455 [Rhodosporidiobolus poonsookiae]
MRAQHQPFDLSTLGADWQVEQGKSGPKFARLTKEVERSLNDDRQYRFIILENGLRALLISDGTTDKAAAALGVQVGHLSDPDDLPGLAHFCEHKYKQYLSQNGGSSNAYTSLSETVYHFDSTPAGLPGALARHAQFFTAPLFDASCTEREVNAVDSEFRRNLQLDARRLFQLGKAVSSPQSVYRKFGTGSKETLWTEPQARSVDSRERLLEWYRDSYSANIMNLVVLSNHSLDELTDIVIAEYSAVPNTNLTAPSFDAPPISPNEGATEISYRTVKDTPQLRIEYGLPDMRPHFATKPGRYLSHFIGHEGPGSILAELKSRGWATFLSAGAGNGAPGFDFFRISINLTASGLAHYQDVLSIVFSYVDLLKSTPPLEWAWQEQQDLGRIAWRWKEKGQVQSTVRNLASNLGESLYPPKRQLVGGWYATDWDEALIKETMEHLRLDNCRVFVGSKEPLPGRQFWAAKEKYYGTEYDQYPLDIDRLKAPLSPPAKLALPDHNIFIPSKLDLVTEEPAKEPFMRPTLVRKTPTSRLWVKTDDMWCIPRGTIYLMLRSPLADLDPRHAVLTQLFTSLVEEALVSYSYDATLAGLDYSFGTEAEGVLLVVSGYTDKLPLLMKVVLEKIRAFKVEGKTFELVHDRLVRAYKNAKLNNPYQIADTHLRRLTRQTYWTWDERLEALQGLSSADVEQHGSLLLDEISIDALMHGNFRREDAVGMLDEAEQVLRATTGEEAKKHYHRALILPEGSTTVYRPLVASPENVNSAASVYYQVGDATEYDLLARLSLFAQIAKVPVFSTLRTKEQLGYIVASGAWTLNAWCGFRVVVQSERHAEYLDERVEALWSGFGEHLEKMDEGEFAKERESLAAKKLEKVKSLGQESGRYWQEVHSGELDFFHRERQASIIRNLSKADMLAFFSRYISPSSTSRTKLAILMRSQRLQPSSLDALVSAVRSAHPSSAEAVDTLAASKPTLDAVEDFVRTTLGDNVDEAVFVALEKLKKLQSLPESATELKEDEVEGFRRSLPLAEGCKAVKTYEEDLVSQPRL